MKELDEGRSRGLTHRFKKPWLVPGGLLTAGIGFGVDEAGSEVLWW